jgi:hypothetical protein
MLGAAERREHRGCGQNCQEDQQPVPDPRPLHPGFLPEPGDVNALGFGLASDRLGVRAELVEALALLLRPGAVGVPADLEQLALKGLDVDLVPG